jgi:dihydroorotase-like cyclic amidohydrolase
MCVLIKNALVTTEKGSYRSNVIVEGQEVHPAADEQNEESKRVIDASKAVSENIIDWFNRVDQ